MSQEYVPTANSSRARPSGGKQHEEDPAKHYRPNYLTVGTGPQSEHADRLAELLDDDSGYGSLVDGTSWSAALSEDRPVPSLADGASDSDRKAVASHIHQLYYNHNRTALIRSITRTVDQLQKLKTKNQEWPAHYPSMQTPAPQSPHHDARPGLYHTQTTTDDTTERTRARPQMAHRADTVGADNSTVPESSVAAAQKAVPEPRLVTPQLARDFSVLKLDLKMDGLPQTEIIHSLRKDSEALARLLDGQINKSLRHLAALRERIEDTSSKVLITGDLNAGKSTFCNALLRRKVLPEDEQPCTSIFCEVLDVGENGGIEEVHAIPIGSKYNRNDERTYDVYPLQKLESIVLDSEHYSQCKVYIKDIRSVDESLLNNGVLDIALIDAPGLNSDSLKTTAVFARQEEIDVVVFVVSAANHFTLSAREFIYDAAREKAFIFMVVNGFDNIKNKQRCQEQILKQVAHLSPATFKESRDLVHFVSSNAIPVAPVGSGGSAGAPSGSGAGRRDPSDDPDDDPKDDEDPNSGLPQSPNDKGKGKDREKLQDFEHLEASLRRFVLEKRARSKLAPAKTYLLNVLNDLHSLGTVNVDMAQSELDRVLNELHELEPVIDKSKRARTEVGDEIDHMTEQTVSEVYSHTKETLTISISDVSNRDLQVEYPGFWEIYRFADDLTSAMLQEISHTVELCEDFAREKTGEGVNSITAVGLRQLGDGYNVFTFQKDRMLRRRKDALARQVDIDVEVWDFFDVTSLWERQEKVASTSMAVTVAGLVGTRMIGGVGWVDGVLGAARVAGSRNLQRLIVPGLIAALVLGVSYAIASIPQTLPRRLSNKVAAQLAAIDYTHSNAMRISHEVRKALKYPADKLHSGLEKDFEQLQNKREKTVKIRSESEVALKYFANLVRDSNDIRIGVERVDLEGPAPGIAGSFDF